MVQISEELMIKFINNTCTDEELLAVKHWLDESDENVTKLFELENMAMLAGTLRSDEASRKRVAAGMKQRIINEEMRMKRHARTLMWRWMSAAAAVVVVAVLATFLYMRPGVTMLKAVALNESRVVTLPDGTTVYLNKNSELTYPEHFASSTREVELSGEGFFKVTRDEKHPFVVNGRYVNVTVLGTEFNFNSRESSGECNVSLVEGSVKVATNSGNEGVVLVPDQKAVYDVATGNITVAETNASVDVAWHDKVIPFENATMQDIRDILVQLYKGDIALDGNLDIDKTYSGVTIFYESIDSTLTQLSNTLPIKFNHSNSSITISAKEN